MIDLAAKSAAADLLPVQVAGCVLTEREIGRITSVMRSKRQDAAFQLPAPGQITRVDGCQCVWTGRNQAMVLGEVCDMRGVLTTDQTDAWTVLALEGPLVDRVLMRLCPVDVRDKAFGVSQSMATQLQHVAVILMRQADDQVDVMVPRSTTATAVHDLQRAMQSVAAQSS